MSQFNENGTSQATVQRPTKAELAAITMNMANLKNMQADLVTSELKYRRLFESAKDGILILDAVTGVIVDINPFLLHLLGYNTQECIGKKLWDIGFFKNVPISKKLFEELKETGYVRYDDIPLETKDGRAIQVEFVSNVYNVSGSSVVQCNIRDITERKQADDNLRRVESKLSQSQKMEGIGRLAGGIAHDFNNLLTAILGYSELVIQSLSPSDPNRHDVMQILKAGERAATLTRQLLAFSRQQVVTTKVLDINATITDLNTMLRRIIGENIELTFLPGRELGHVKAAPGQIEQIVLNLCVNAKDAMPNGGKLLIETSNVELGDDYRQSHPQIKMGPYVMAAISDNGIGMTADVLSHLYEPFFTTKEQGKGTGLGLSTVYGIVEQNNGQIEVYSELGHGTTFKIYFPRVDEPLFTGKAGAVASALHRGNETILLVEDDELVRLFAARVLKENGYTVLIANNPTEALRIFQEHKSDIHLMLTDVVMPGMLGYELARQLSLAKPEMKVIYMSGYTEQSIIQRAILQGASFIQKPMTAEVILREIRKALDAPVNSE